MQNLVFLRLTHCSLTVECSLTFRNTSSVLKSMCEALRKGNVNAGIAQLVERNLAKVEVASSNLVSRSKRYWRNGRMAMQRIANPWISVRLRVPPPLKDEIALEKLSLSQQYMLLTA